MRSHPTPLASSLVHRYTASQDEDGSGEVDFREFVTSLWNYCTVGPHALSIFAFDMYDCDSSGTIDKDEIRLMLKEVYGDEFDRNEFAHRILA